MNATTPPRIELPFRHHHRQIERHADAHEEERKQNAAERLDVGFELMAERGFREQNAGKERAHRHREAAQFP